MFKLIASDLDGTLLNSNKEISDYSVKVLKQAQEKGVDFAVCTGRMYGSMEYLMPKLTFSKYSINIMGAEIYNNFTKERIYFRPLEDEHVEKIVRYATDNKVHMNLYIDNVLYTNFDDEFRHWYHQETTSLGIVIEGDLLEFIKGKKLSKILFISEPEVAKQHFENMQKMFGDELNICASHPRYVEFSHIDAQKDKTLLVLLDMLNIKKEELIVFGDSGNDVSMLKNTGFSCCVANGWDEAKQVSNLIVESNDNDGVAKTVKRLILDR